MAKESKIRIVVVRVDADPVEEVIENNLRAMQKIVDGYIELVSMPQGLDLYCNEEGRLIGLPPNCLVKDAKGVGRTILGNFFICRHDAHGHNTSLLDADVTELLKKIGIESES